MSYYYGKVPWIDYLQNKSFADSIRGEIRSSTRSLITATGNSQRAQISATERASTELSNQVWSLSNKMERGLTELNSTFSWGFSGILMSLGAVSASLEELKRIAANPSKNWAFEQFNEARDAYRKQLFPEALNWINRAINGHGNHVGYELDYRFHYFLGILRVGNFDNNTREIVDLVQGKAAFLNAARYALHDEPIEAAKAYFGAGFASYAQGQMGDARTYYEQACLLDPSLSVASFQLAKVALVLNDTDSGVKHLRTAILHDPGYATKATEDKDFQHEAVDLLLATFAREAKGPYEQALTICQEKLQVLQQRTAENPSHSSFSEMQKISELLSEAHALSAADTYEGYLEATVRADLARSRIAKETGRIHIELAHIRAELAAQARKERESKDDAKRKELAARVAQSKDVALFAKIAMLLSLGGLLCFGFPCVVGLVLGSFSLTRLQRFEESEVREQAILRTAKTQAVVAVIVGGIITFMLGLVVLEEISKGLKR